MQILYSFTINYLTKRTSSPTAINQSNQVKDTATLPYDTVEEISKDGSM